MNKTKRMREMEAALRERARARRPREEQKPAKQKPAKRERSQKQQAPIVAEGKRSGPKDYEPQERPLSTFNARHAFLSKILEIAPRVVDTLFDSCMESFLTLTRRTRPFQAGDDPLTVAESNPLDWLELDEEELKQVEINPGFEGLAELQDRIAEEREFCGRLTAWGRECGIDERWFLEFGWLALLHYWQETRPQILKAAPPSVSESERRNLLINPPGRVTVNVSEQRGARAVAAVLGDRAHLLPMVPARPAVDTVEIIQKRRRKAWYAALRYLAGDRDTQMTAPEHKWSNRYEMVGFFRSIEKPKYLQLQPPAPPAGLPPIAGGGLGRVMTRDLYARAVEMDLQMQFARGPMCLLSGDVRKKWLQEALLHLAPHIDAYWREYTDYLKAQGWIPVKPKRVLRLHCEWLARFVVLGMSLPEIAETVNRARGISEQAISDAIRDVASLAGVRWKERRGRKSS